MKHLNLKRAFSVLLAVAMILSLFAAQAVPEKKLPRRRKAVKDLHLKTNRKALIRSRKPIRQAALIRLSRNRPPNRKAPR